MTRSAQKSVRLRILGRVQGVGYRAWAVREAAGRGLRGWVRNRRDGSVEALLTGDERQVAAMVEACRDGPFAARVSDILVEDTEDDGAPGFDARPTG